MGFADLTILLLLAGLVYSVIRYMRRLKREGKSCCGGCSACSKGPGGCGEKHKD